MRTQNARTPSFMFANGRERCTTRTRTTTRTSANFVKSTRIQNHSRTSTARSTITRHCSRLKFQIPNPGIVSATHRRAELVGGGSPWERRPRFLSTTPGGVFGQAIFHFNSGNREETFSSHSGRELRRHRTAFDCRRLVSFAPRFVTHCQMVYLSENEGIENCRFVVIGGAGFVGRALCLELVRRGAAEVRSFDKVASAEHLSILRDHGVVCITGDVRKKEDVERALKHANCVFHLASYGMSGKEMLQVRQIDEVNLNGTCNVIDSCLASGVERLVYTSTYNVIFGGKEIRNGHEGMDYFPLEDHVDPYGRSKALAEQLVLKHNNRPLKGREGRKLYTCSVRPAAIYGPGEERHLPRILGLARAGLLLFCVGGWDTKQDWVYVDNLVQAQLLASMALLDDVHGQGVKATGAGQAYFISDGAPVNTRKFLQDFVERVGYKYPDRALSVQTAMQVAWLVWGVYGLGYALLEKRWLPQPLILPAEVHKVGVTHFFSLLKARQELGYVPIINPKEGMDRTVAYFTEKREAGIIRPSFFTFFLVFLGLLCAFVSAYVPENFQGPFTYPTKLGLLLFRSTFALQIIFNVAVAIHFAEGCYAWLLARKVDPKNASEWFWQTFALGFPSLMLLLQRAKSRDKLK